MIAPFEASKLKLDRAATHMRELESAIAAYLAGKPCAIVAEHFPGMELSYSTHAWTARIRKPVPLELSAIIGDVVHNLRASLDLVICDLVRINGRGVDKVHFPFCATAAELPKAIADRNIHKAGADVVQLISSLKPYRGGHDALRALHDMDVSDKHQALIPLLGAATLPLRGLLGPKVPRELANFSTLIAKDGQIIIGLPASIGIPLGTELPSRFFLAFGDGPGFGGKTVLEFLHHLAEVADGVIKALTALRPGAAFPSAAKA
jgi:hypothetical protein